MWVTPARVARPSGRRVILAPVRIRDAQFDDDPRPAGADPVAPVEKVAYQVPGRLTVVKFGLAAVIAVAALLAADRVGLALGLAAALGVAAYATRDLIAPVRLTADREGLVVVRGYAGRRRLAWSDIVAVRVDERSRFGRAAATLEVDADTEIYLFSANDLGVAPAEAEQALARLRPVTS